jgi:hypothetical protein
VISELSFVWVCDDASDDLESTLRLYLATIQSQPLPSHLLIVNNGLGPSASNRLAALLRQSGIDSCLISTNMPCAESTALSIAFKQTTGDVVVVLPSYPQSDPDDIDRMLDGVRDGLDYVASWRTPRIDGKADQSQSRLFNWMAGWFSGVRLHDINSGLRVMRRATIEHLPLYGDLHVYLPILAARQGFRVGEVPVRHLQERPSKSARGAAIYLRRALDLLTLFFLIRFTQKPFRFFGGIGTILLAVGGLTLSVLGVQRIFFGTGLANRPMLVLGTLLMVVGIQMFSLGLIGELIIFVSAGGMADYQVEQFFRSSTNSNGDSWHTD